MGPILICDKSTLQSLNPSELNALRKYYSLNIPPVLLVEILGDLKKHANSQAGREEVRILANKLMPACSTVNTNFRELIRGELTGVASFPMDGRPVLTGGKHVISPEGKKGVIFEISPEAEALLRWQTGKFREAEELMAEAWRLSTLTIDLESMQRQLRGTYSGKLNLQTLASTAKFVDDLMSTVAPDLLLIWFLQDIIGMFGEKAIQAVQKFRNATPGSLNSTAPYTAYCVRAALIFHFALAFGLVSTRPTNRIDLEYLYYVPFCNAFSSGDTFHRKMASLVIRDQMYADRDELKADLKQLADWWSKLTNEQREEESPTSGPPENEKSVTHRAWQKVMRPGYRERSRQKMKPPPEGFKSVADWKQLVDTSTPMNQPMQEDDCDFMIVKHSVRLDGPCICGGEKLFKDCCGRGIAESVAKQ